MKINSEQITKFKSLMMIFLKLESKQQNHLICLSKKYIIPRSIYKLKMIREIKAQHEYKRHINEKRFETYKLHRYACQ